MRPPSFFETNFWKVFSSMFAIEHWNDLAEMRRYVHRFMHDIDKMVKGTGEMVTPYHNHDSIIVPVTTWLSGQGVNFETGCKVTDLDFKPSRDELTVERLHYTRDGEVRELAIGEGDYVGKKMSDCSGEELLTEVCRHFGFEKELPHILETSTCIPQMMPYEMAHFLPRKRSDRPRVVPDGSTNLAFMGQFVESEECVMLVESSVRCGMMAAYSFLGVDREVPPVYTGVRSLAVWYRVLRTVLK